MSNAWYPEYVEAVLTGAANVDLTTGTLKATLVDTADYTYSSAHDFIADVPSGARVATTTLASPTVTGKVLDADDATFSSVTGDQAEAIVIWKDTGSEATSRLVLYLDTGVTGLPVTPSGGDVLVTWDATGIAALGTP